MADGKGLQSRHHRNAAAYLGVELDIVGHLEVVDYRVEHFVHFSARRDQTNALETVSDVVLRLRSEERRVGKECRARWAEQSSKNRSKNEKCRRVGQTCSSR